AGSRSPPASLPARRSGARSPCRFPASLRSRGPRRRRSSSPWERLVRGRAAGNLVPARPVGGDTRAFFGLGCGVAEAVEELHLLLRVTAYLVPLGEALYELKHARATLGCGVRSPGHDG